MAQRIMRKKNRTTVKGVAIKRTGGSNPNNTVTVGNVTYRGGGKSTAKRSGNKTRKRRKKRK